MTPRNSSILMSQAASLVMRLASVHASLRYTAKFYRVYDKALARFERRSKASSKHLGGVS